MCQNAFFAPVRQLLADAIGRATGRDIPPDWIDCLAKGYPARSAAALKLGIDAGELAQFLQTRREDCGVLFGAPLVQSVEAKQGHLLFSFTPAFYTGAVETVLSCFAPVEGPFAVGGPDRVRYGLQRMWMLSRKPHCGCPDDRVVQRALWLALGIPERLGQPRPLCRRLQEATDALLGMSYHLPPRRRPHMLNVCGGVADAAARLLYCGLESLQVEEVDAK